MKIFVLLTFFIINLNAGGYYNNVRQGYDLETSLFYYSVKNKPESGGLFSSEKNTRIKNILIFDPKTEEQWYVFEPNKVWDIRFFTFESHKDEKNKIKFFYGNHKIENEAVKSRKLKDKLLIITSKKDSETLTMWFSTKRGKNLKKIYTFNKSDRWHLDLKNSKIRFITHKDKISIKSIDW